MDFNYFKSKTMWIFDSARNILDMKNSSYTNGEKTKSAIHNFEEGVRMGAGNNPAQVAWAYMTKHLVALKDMVDDAEFTDHIEAAEKCKDVMNYVSIIYAIICSRNDEKGD